MRITTDMIAVGGLAVALIAGIVLELLTGIAGGLSGYICKTIQQGGETK